MSTGHDHGAGAGERTMWWAFGLTGSFMVAEALGGLLTGSLALISDAAHMLTDTVALAIALLAIRLGKKAADRRRTFGYSRFEIIAAAFNAGMLFIVAIYILYEAWERLMRPPEIESVAMLIIAAIGLAVNFLSMRLLATGKDKSLNMKGAYLEVWSDMLGSLGVIVGALLIYFTGWTQIDPLIAIAIALWVLPRTYVLLKESMNVLLEGVPRGIDLDRIEAMMRADASVRDVHELHVWSLSSGKTSLMAHAVLLPDTQTDVYLAAVRKQMSDQFDIEHITVQCEFEPCSEAAGCEWDAVRHAGHDHDIDAGHEDDPPTQTRLP
jgi:cobalt-zinc-cadmium efflux system protein